MKFRIRAQWQGPNGIQVGVADDEVEAEDACEALIAAIPSPYVTGSYTHATVTVTPLPDVGEETPQ